MNNRLKILSNLDFYEVGKDETGTYPLQYIIENLSTEEEINLTYSKIYPNFGKLCFDKFGSHIIEKVLKKTKYELINSLFQEKVKNHFLEYSLDANGIKVLKIFAVVLFNNKNEKEFESLLNVNLDYLINNQFGNYLIQCIIDNWSIEYSWKIANYFKGKYIILITQKFSSNVIEKLIFKLENVKF